MFLTPQRGKSDSRYLSVDCAIVGAGLIGVSIALELQRRGATVALIEQASSMRAATIAAAGMLASTDPHNPPELKPLSLFSEHLYPDFLNRIASLSGIQIAFQTDTTIQHLPDGTSIELAEHSLDPRELAEALELSVAKSPVHRLEHTSVSSVVATTRGSRLTTVTGIEIHAQNVAFSSGAWTASALSPQSRRLGPIAPRKGQIIRVHLPCDLQEVHRNERVYIVPRLRGPQSGTALIGATLEDTGFDSTLRTIAVGQLRNLSTELLPALASEADAPLVETWTGLRPFTPDSLPIIGALPTPGHFIASGHYRNGILLAPATAQILADLIEAKPLSVDMAAFSPNRFRTARLQ